MAHCNRQHDVTQSVGLATILDSSCECNFTLQHAQHHQIVVHALSTPDSLSEFGCDVDLGMRVSFEM